MGRMRDEDVENATTVEGIEEAYSKIEIFLRKVKKSPENEGQMDVVLSQTSSRKNKDQEDDPVETFELDMQTDIDALASEIVDCAVEDIEGLRAKNMKYNVKAAGLQLRCTFTLKCDDGEEEDMDDVDDMPNRKGLLALLMRHTQGQHKLSIGTSKHMIDQLMEENKRKDETILTLQRQAMENIKAYEELVSGRHVRDMEMKKMENKDRRMDQLAGTVLTGFPLIVSKFLGGGAGAGAMQAVPGARTPMEAMLEGFIKTLDKEQFTALMSTGVLRPDQIAGLVEIVKFVMEREEAEEKAHAAGAGSTNGKAAGPPTPQDPAKAKVADAE
jgi:hypothetical protein